MYLTIDQIERPGGGLVVIHVGGKKYSSRAGSGIDKVNLQPGDRVWPEGHGVKTRYGDRFSLVGEAHD